MFHVAALLHFNAMQASMRSVIFPAPSIVTSTATHLLKLSLNLVPHSLDYRAFSLLGLLPSSIYIIQ